MTIQVSVLKNGLRVATDTIEGAESVVVGCWVGVGTRHEPWAANGVAHFVEHMMFKGTKRHTAYELSAVIERKGGAMNAHTSREETAYYARVLPEDAAQAADIIADMLLHSQMAEAELTKERQVVLQEIGRDLDTPEDHIGDLLNEAAYPKQKMGRSILGAASVVAKLPRKALIDYINKYYCTNNMVLVGAGKITHEAMVEIGNRYFSKFKRGTKAKTEKALVKTGEIRQEQDNEQLHLMMAFAGPSRMTKTVYAASLLGVVMGGTSSSRLFQKVREERGLVYAISANHNAFQDSGLFNVYAGTDPNRAKELMPVVCREFKDVTKRLKQDELDLAKAQVRADFLMGRESVMRRAEILGHQILAFGKPIPTEKTLAKLMAVTVDETRAIAAKLISRPPILAALGPLHTLEPYSKIVERLKA